MKTHHFSKQNDNLSTESMKESQSKQTEVFDYRIRYGNIYQSCCRFFQISKQGTYENLGSSIKAILESSN